MPAINFDFTLLKLEAGSEFKGLYDSLSPKRIKEAEQGQHHITARQLEALFEVELPSVPNLISKYGRRVSEICSDLKTSSKSFSEVSIFSSQAGPDGLSIWAGATSGFEAIVAHLLAYLLARIWKSHEAISLWVEIVERKK
ncbi:hypothetical protein BGZ61DRAFT_534531 [Ilyonectria robusta]|uniref:uncharacterized protein n=1 Tax=Ilyonectria robusta TaxID=1079257 RepID=UPI001E8E1E30|nr:uncharacterized protein BGZ61DRAFT_534531 [Ilyonectria robusta]KAH8683835.1 hypothetical protein BGZ61DRAFT_534531 [Ilyonectria robusta]